MPIHLIRNFYIAKSFVDSKANRENIRLPALKGRDLAIVLKYIKLLSPIEE